MRVRKVCNKKGFCFRLALWDFNNTEGCMFVKSSESNDNLKKTFYDCVNLAEEKHASHGQADILTVSKVCSHIVGFYGASV